MHILPTRSNVTNMSPCKSFRIDFAPTGASFVKKKEKNEDLRSHITMMMVYYVSIS
ncbi:hypothetical protein NKDENANG_03850 [Candidatus Entotheonellaceae bacterium PAL068K]